MTTYSTPSDIWQHISTKIIKEHAEGIIKLPKLTSIVTSPNKIISSISVDGIIKNTKNPLIKMAIAANPQLLLTEYENKLRKIIDTSDGVAIIHVASIRYKHLDKPEDADSLSELEEKFAKLNLVNGAIIILETENIIKAKVFNDEHDELKQIDEIVININDDNYSEVKSLTSHILPVQILFKGEKQ